jgi:hypothetical protein
MAWTFAGVRIFVQSSKTEGEQIVPRLQPLAGNTVLQVFGYGGEIRSIAGLIVGNTDYDTLLNTRTTALNYDLTTPEGQTISYLVKSISLTREPKTCQTFRSDLAEDAPVYTVELQLYRN